MTCIDVDLWMYSSHLRSQLAGGQREKNPSTLLLPAFDLFMYHMSFTSPQGLPAPDPDANGPKLPSPLHFQKATCPSHHSDQSGQAGQSRPGQGRQRAEGRGQRAEGRGQRAEGRAEGRDQRAEGEGRGQRAGQRAAGARGKQQGAGHGAGGRGQGAGGRGQGAGGRGQGAGGRGQGRGRAGQGNSAKGTTLGPLGSYLVRV